MTAPADQDASALSDQAIEWLVRLHSGQDTEADRQALALWQTQSPEHAQAFAKTSRLWMERAMSWRNP